MSDLRITNGKSRNASIVDFYAGQIADLLERRLAEMEPEKRARVIEQLRNLTPEQREQVFTATNDTQVARDAFDRAMAGTTSE